jgi:hypothetical protein
MRRAARVGIGAGILTGLGAVAVKVRRKVADRRNARRARADEARRNLWPPVPVKPAGAVHIDAERASTEL